MAAPLASSSPAATASPAAPALPSSPAEPRAPCLRMSFDISSGCEVTWAHGATAEAAAEGAGMEDDDAGADAAASEAPSRRDLNFLARRISSRDCGEHWQHSQPVHRAQARDRGGGSEFTASADSSLKSHAHMQHRH